MPNNASMIFVVSAKDDASKTIEQINRQIANVGKSAGGASGKGMELPGFDLGNITQSLQSLGGGAGGIASMIGDMIPVAGLGVAAGALAAVSWQLGEAGSQTLRTQQSFDSLSSSVGISSQAMLSAMQNASRGTVSNAELMAAANRALVLGVATSAEQMAALTEAAITRGRQVGVGATQAVNDLVTGIGRMSPEILDNLGITGAKQSFDTYAASLGTTADKLDDVQKKQALVNAVLASTQGVTVVDDAASSFERMDAAIQNAKDALGVMFAPAIAAIAEKLAEAAKGVTDEMQRQAQIAAQADMAAYGDSITTVAEAYQKAQEAMSVGVVSQNPKTMQEAAMNMDMLSFSLVDLANKYNAAAAVTGAPLIDVGQIQGGVIAFADASTAAQGLGSSMVSAGNQAGYINSQISAVRANLAALTGQADATGSALRSAFMGMGQVLGVAGAMGGLKDAQKELENMRTAWALSGMTAEEMGFRERAFLDDTNAKLSEQRQQWQDLTQGVKAHGSAVSTAEQQYNSLLGRVQSVLSGALNLDIGVKADDLLPREDAVNENARRLAAIAKEGLNGQSWLPDFQATAPGAWADLRLKMAEGVDAKTAAAQILRDFEDGLRPDLLDANKAKDLVRRAILGDQSMSAMAAQIAGELSAELGVPLQQAQEAAASVLGTGKGTDKTKTGSEGFAAGFGTSANGAVLATTIAAQMIAAYAEFEKAGTSAGGKWGATFYTSVEQNMAPQLINLLVTLTTPGVLALIQSQTSTTTPPA